MCRNIDTGVFTARVRYAPSGSSKYHRVRHGLSLPDLDAYLGNFRKMLDKSSHRSNTLVLPVTKNLAPSWKEQKQMKDNSVHVKMIAPLTLFVVR